MYQKIIWKLLFSPFPCELKSSLQHRNIYARLTIDVQQFVTKFPILEFKNLLFWYDQWKNLSIRNGRTPNSTPFLSSTSAAPASSSAVEGRLRSSGTLISSSSSAPSFRSKPK